jgi:nucleoside-diphosphate-sugar epimerase
VVRIAWTQEDVMKIFIAGGSGTIGMPLVRALASLGHHVTALTRSPGKRDALRAAGAEPAVADALDAEGLRRVVLAAAPTHVIHQLTALPKEGVNRASDVAPTNRLRIEGTRNLIDASIRAGATRIVGGSFALFQAAGPDTPPDARAAVAAIQSMESQILDASRSGSIEGVVLRYGLFYGLANPMTQRMIRLVMRRMLPVVRGDRGQLPCIHLDDAVSATVLALDRAPAGSSYDIVDDRAVSMSQIVTALAEATGSPAPFTVPKWLPRLLAPYMARMLDMQLPLSNAQARSDLGWVPRYATWTEGVREMLDRAA